MTATQPIPVPMPVLPRPGQQVRWRDPRHAHVWGWDEVFGPGPLEVLRRVDKSALGLASGLVRRTALGEWEISEVWLAPGDEPGDGGPGR